MNLLPRLLRRFRFFQLAASALLLSPCAITAAEIPPVRSQSFILGADVSWTLQDEAAGATYHDRGVQKDLLQILGDHGINYIRLRVFVNPSAPRGYNGQGFCDLEHTKIMARRVKAAGMGFLLDFHYGDTWTSPGHQEKPSAWRDLDFPALTQAVHDWTHQVVLALKEQGTPPDMVQIGNEISDGMLFPDGRRSNPANFAALTKAGCTAVREIDPKIQIMLHNHLGRDNAAVRAWVDNFLEHGVDFDLIGLSCYAQKQEGDWKNNFTDLASRYPKLKIVAAEYSPKKREINDLIHAIPGGKGLGTFIWEPTRHLEATFDRAGVNAGGGARTTNDEGLVEHTVPGNPGRGVATPPPTVPPATGLASPVANPAAPPAAATPARGRRGNRNGGRYDTNDFMEIYDQMAEDYGNRPSRKSSQ